MNRRALDMPQLALLAVIGAGFYAGYKIVAKIAGAHRADAHPEPAQTHGNSRTRDLGDLELDATSGVYRPKRG